MTPEKLRKSVNLVIRFGEILYKERNINNKLVTYFDDILGRTLSLLNEIDYAAMIYARYGTENADRYSWFFVDYTPSTNNKKLPLSSSKKLEVTERILKELE
jgi:hypothetical protein